MKNLLKEPISILISLGAALPAVAAPITTESLLAELYDLRRLSTIGGPRYTASQASSFDRASKSPGENWFANSDFGQYIRKEVTDGRSEWVMADLTGPGAVVRIWSANPQGVTRFYFDGEAEARVAVALNELVTGKSSLLPQELSYVAASGANLYFPFPYSRSLKITVDDSSGGNPDRLYYHINFRTYEPGTEVRTFSAQDFLSLPLERLRRMLFDPEEQVDRLSQTFGATFFIEPGERFDYKLPEGNGSVVELRMKVRGPARSDEDTLRMVLFEATFDERKTISCPVGDYFGSAPGLAGYKTLPLGMDTELEEMRSYWRMPQRESGQFTFTNHAEHSVRIEINLRWMSEPWTDTSMHFHAKWRRETMRTRPMKDWSILSVAGEGRFVGCALYVVNPTRIWWGEGDEKIYVDGESFPSTFGTGTEDYFGYAWGSNETFSRPFHAQPRADGPANRGYTSNNRFHIIDDIPFRSSLRFDIEIWHWADVTADFASVAYWYARPGSTDRFEAIGEKDLAIHQLPSYGVKGAIEGESLRLIDHSGGTIQRQALDDKWSREEQVWWRDASPGDSAKWEVLSEKSGALRLIGNFTEAADYGIVQLFWNGEKLGEPIDFFSPVLGLRKIDFGIVEIKSTNTLEARVVGANERAERRHMFGIDYFLIGESQ